MMFSWVFKGNVGIAITGVSIAVSIGCLPLYAKAERLQEKDREIQKKLAARGASIKSRFKGDEQYMLLSTYYRQNGYHPLYALRSSVCLLVQVPFLSQCIHAFRISTRFRAKAFGSSAISGRKTR